MNLLESNSSVGGGILHWILQRNPILVRITVGVVPHIWGPGYKDVVRISKSEVLSRP